LDGHVLCRADIVHFGHGNSHVNRASCIRIVDDMRLGAADTGRGQGGCREAGGGTGQRAPG
ncbi:MAG: hypothetical protein ACLPX9_08265, partial [Rhodomicrobium sp.]